MLPRLVRSSNAAHAARWMLLLAVGCSDGSGRAADPVTAPSPTETSEGEPSDVAEAMPSDSAPVASPNGVPRASNVPPPTSEAPIESPALDPPSIEPSDPPAVNPSDENGGTGATEPPPSSAGAAGHASLAGAGGEPPGAGGSSAGAGGASGAPPVAGDGCPASPGTPPSGNLSATLVEGVEPADYDYHLYEGAAWLGDALYFSDIEPSPWNSTIRAYVPATGMVTDFLVGAGSNGLAVSADGILHSATAAKGEISRYTSSPAMQETVLPGPFNSPNDLAIAGDGTIYFSDPQQGEITPGNQPQLVHVVKDGVDAIFSEAITSPNGVTLSPDDAILYVSGGGYSGYVKKVTLVDGLAGTIEDVASELQVPDGMSVDCAGNLYVALHELQQVAVFDPNGLQIATISIGAAANGQAGKPTNVAFGGADGKTLFVTAAYSLWQLPLEITGRPY